MDGLTAKPVVHLLQLTQVLSDPPHYLLDVCLGEQRAEFTFYSETELMDYHEFRIWCVRLLHYAPPKTETDEADWNADLNILLKSVGVKRP